MTGPIDPDQQEDEIKKEEPLQQDRKDESSLQDQMSTRLNELKQNENVKKVVNFARSNTKDTVAYILLFLGILLLFFQPFWGGLIIGAVGGLYFANPIIDWVRHFQDYLDKEGLVKVLILTCVALGFLIVAPAFFLGAAGAIGIKFILVGETKS